MIVPFREDAVDPWSIRDAHGLDHVTGWEPYGPHDLAHVSCVGSVLHSFCITYHNDRYRIH